MPAHQVVAAHNFFFLGGRIKKNSHSKKALPMSKATASSARKRKTSVASAPTFDTARVELYKSLNQWVFARVLHPCTVPTGPSPTGPSARATQKQQGYFHGIAIAEDGENARQRIWFKKHVSHRQSVFIGPVKIEAPQDAFIPEPGDVLMGKLAPSTANPKDGKKAQSPKFVLWYPMTNHLLTLLSIVRNGTTTSETALCNELRPPRPSVSFGCKKKRVVPKGEDDTWALARLILFGNINIFAEEHQNARQGMNLSYPPLEFVYRCSSFFNDATIWSRFKEIVPAAEEPVDSESSCLSNDDEDDDERGTHTTSKQTVQPITHPWSLHGKPAGYSADLYSRYSADVDVVLPDAYDPFNPDGKNPPLPQTPPPACPVSPVYSPFTPPASPKSPAPPVSPPYFPVTPPGSPAYSPVTPPVSPPYCPPASPPPSPPASIQYDSHDVTNNSELYFTSNGPPPTHTGATTHTAAMMTIQDLQKIMAEVSSLQQQKSRAPGDGDALL